MPFDRIIFTIGLAAVTGFSAVGPSASADADSPEDWRSGYAQLSALGRGFVVWESSRSGRWRIYRKELDGSNLRRISPDEAGRDHYCPHISPDGKRLVYLSYPTNHNTYEAFDRRFDDKAPLHLLSADGRFDRIIAPDARAYGEDRGAVWLNDSELVYIAGDYTTIRLNVETGEQTVLLGAPPKGRLPVLLSADLRYATSGEPTFSPYDLQTRKVQWRKEQGGCQPYFTRNGLWGFWMGGGGGPINRYHLETGKAGPILTRRDPRMPRDRDYLYFPMISPCGRLFAFGASPGQHDHFNSDYDIFVAAIDPQTMELTGKPVRYTFDKGCDRFPDVYLEAPAQTAHAQSPPNSAKAPPKTGRADTRSKPGAPVAAWPPSRTGLVFLWETGDKPNLVGRQGEERTCEVKPRGRARLNGRFAMAISDGAYTADQFSASLLDACRKTNQLTLEITLTPAGLEVGGPARIATFSSSSQSRNFTLGQEKDHLIFRLRTPSTGENGYNPEVTLCKIQPDRPVNIIVTYAPGQLIAYRDGVEVFRTDRIRGDFRNWSPQRLLFGDEWDGERQWNGTVEGVAIYDRALSPDEAAAHAASYRRILERRKPAPRIRVRAVLATKSKIPTLAEIRPYKSALVLYEYRVAAVLSGKYTGGRIRVAHWVILNGETLRAASAKPGAQTELTLEPFEANGQLESQYLSDTLPRNWDLTTYFDVGPP